MTARASLVFCFAAALSAAPPQLVSVRKIWDAAPHNAFTDLIRFHNVWYCTFREAEGHVKGDGKLRVLASTDGESWQPAALLAESGTDLRDPKLSITPDGRLMILAGGSVYRDGTLAGRRPRVAFSKDGRSWTTLEPILAEGDWLWRVTWGEGRAYGVSYRQGGGVLYSSADGLHYQEVATLQVPGISEVTLRFLPGGEMMALARRDTGNRHAWIGTSRAPYREWKWREVDHAVGGPNFIRLPDGTLWAAGRESGAGPATVLARITRESYEPVLTLPSGGDTSYPGLVWESGDRRLWMSYYSTHEGQTSIYLAKIRLN